MLPRAYGSVPFWLCVLMALIIICLPRLATKARHALQAPSGAKTVKRLLRAEAQAARETARESARQTAREAVSKFKDQVDEQEDAARRALLAQARP